MPFTVEATIKKFFFDRALVKSAIGEDQAKVLGRAGGYVRKVARSSIKLKGKARKNNTTKLALREAAQQPASPAGTPPFAHTDDDVVTLRNIQYGLDLSTMKVVVGPLALNQKNSGIIGGLFNSRGTIPALHEFGGTALIREKRVGIQWVPMGRRKPRPGQPTRRRSATYPARPFMFPALEKSAPKFPSLFFQSGGN